MVTPPSLGFTACASAPPMRGGEQRKKGGRGGEDGTRRDRNGELRVKGRCRGN